MARSRRRRGTVLARGLLPMIVVVASVAAACARGGHPHVSAAPPPPPPTVAPAPAAPLPPPPSEVATAKVPRVAIFAAPGADVPSTSLGNPNEFDVPLVFLVKEVQPDWLRVMLPSRPNGATGWVRAADVELSSDPWRLQVELGAHRLTVWQGADVVRQETVAVGTAAAPTPTGDFYVTELLDTGNPRGPYGPYAFGLSAFSDVYTSFAGGPGQVGLHGTNEPAALGSDASHGCVRMSNAAITALAHQVPPGTPISIVA